MFQILLEEDPEDVEVTETNLQSGNKEKGGQPPLIKQFPDIVNIVVEFVKQQGYAAQHRRRDETVYSSGVTISQIREYLFQQIPGLREYGISKSTIRRLFNPPPPPHTHTHTHTTTTIRVEILNRDTRVV